MEHKCTQASWSKDNHENQIKTGKDDIDMTVVNELIANIGIIEGDDEI